MQRRIPSLAALLLLAGAASRDPAASLLPAAASPSPPSAARRSQLRLLEEPEAGVGPIDALLRSARRSVDVELYELEDPTAEAILAADAARGVRVRVLLDKAYVERENQSAFSYLSSHQVAVRWAPARFDLTHEKAIVVDGSTALVMTMNLTVRYYATTRDVAVVDTEPADVVAIEEVFREDWTGRGDPDPPPGADLLWSPGSEQALVSLVEGARHELLVENEEMDDPEVTDALASAARRGVHVVVVMTAERDWDRAFDELASAGVEVRTYPDTATHLYIHAKVVDADPRTAGGRVFVGSENFSVASLVYNRELGLLTTDPALVRPLAVMIERDAAGGRPRT